MDEETRLQHYAATLDQAVYDAATLRRWLRRAKPAEVKQLEWTHETLLQRARPADAEVLFPSHLALGANRLPLTYRFEPGHDHDGVTLSVPLTLLHELDPHTGEWLVPGLHREKVTALIKGLPKPLRRHFVPAPDFAQACVESLSASDGLYAGVSRQLQAMTGVECPQRELVAVELPPHLRMRFRVLDSDGATLAEGRDLAALQEQFGDTAAAHDDAGYEREGLHDWDFGELPEYLESSHDGLTVRVYPALVAEADGVALRCFPSAARAHAAMPAGLRELVKQRLHRELRYLRRNIAHLNEMCIWFVRVGSCDELREDLLDAAVAEVLLASEAGPRDRDAFETVVETTRTAVTGVVNEFAQATRGILQVHHEISNRLSGSLPLSWIEAANDIRDQLAHLVYPGFLSATPRARLNDYPRYLQAIALRLDTLDRDPERDRQRRAQLEPLWASCKQLLGDARADRNAVAEVRWLIEELRVSVYAQRLGTRDKVSIARVEKRLDALQLERRR